MLPSPMARAMRKDTVGNLLHRPVRCKLVQALLYTSSTTPAKNPNTFN